jgi:hypothetical protein
MGEQELINELQGLLSDLLEKIGEEYQNPTSVEYIHDYLETLVDSCNFWSKANNPQRIIYDIENAISHFDLYFPISYE